LGKQFRETLSQTKENKNLHKKGLGRMAQSVGAEFKPQYHRKKRGGHTNKQLKPF
jgi:hypothetical protein